MRILILTMVFSKLIFAQYDSTMYDLIKTTYSRSFDKQIISKYLDSDNDCQTRAAILSIAQSEDTSFVPELFKLDLTKYGSEVCFALAQIGNCDQSINFLWKYLHSSPLPDQFPKIFFAIGKIGDERDLQKLLEFYNSFDGPIFPYEGISEAILQFQIRGITSDEVKSILEIEVTHKLSSNTRIALALFTLVKYGGTISIQKNINNFLSELNIEYLSATDRLNSFDFDTITRIRQFSLMNLSAIKLFPLDVTYFARVPKLTPFNKMIQIFCAKTFIYTNFEKHPYSKDWLGSYLDFLGNDNPNVAIETAISLKFLNKSSADLFLDYIKDKIDSVFFDSTKSLSIKGELFLSRYELFGEFEKHESMMRTLGLPTKYQIQFYSKNSNKENAFKKISYFYWNSSEVKDKIESLSQMLELKSEQKYEVDFNKILITSLTSTYAPLISIAADGIDSLFISENSIQLKEIISNHIDTYKDNPDFLEATMSLVNLSEKINTTFYSQMIEKTKTAKLYSIRKFVSSKTGNKQIGFKELDKFEDIWSCAFMYEQATIKTSKGNIVIEFNSNIAPITVANFCMLAKQNFYNGIIFHRVVPGFVIQAGDPTVTGWGGPGYDIVSEYSDTYFGIGYVGMASAGKDTESSQLFIMQGSHPHLDSRYTLFAKVIEGMDLVYNITEEDKLISIELK